MFINPNRKKEPIELDPFTLYWLAEQYVENAEYLCKIKPTEKNDVIAQRAKDEAVKLRVMAKNIKKRQKELTNKRSIR